MKTLQKVFSLFLIITIALLVAPRPALAAPDAKVIMGDSYTLHSGDVLNEDLLILGGSVVLEEDSTVNGDIMLMGGTLWVAGLVQGDLTAAGGVVSLQASAHVTGNFSTLGAQVERNQDAEIDGETFTNQDMPFNFVPGVWQDNFMSSVGTSPIFNIGWLFLRVVLWGLLAMLVVMFLPAHTERVTRAAIRQPLIACGLGIATGLILPILLVVVALTICLIPASLLGLLALVAAWSYGLIALGIELGKRFGQVFKQEWHPALAAGVGTSLLTLILSGLSMVVPCLGWLPQVLVGAVGLGAVLLTRFGTQEYPNEPATVDAVEITPAP
mgnify:CR=1 FL=1